MEHSIDYGQTNIKFTVNRRNRKTLGINVLPTGEVTVDAPQDTSIEKVTEIVHKRAGWILKQKRKISTFHPPMPPKQYLAGETFLYLGDQYRLGVFDSNKNEVILSKDRIKVYSKVGTDPINIKNQLNKWFREEAKRVFEERLSACMPRVENIDITSMPTLKIRKMEKRWGSCTLDGHIILNLELISASIDCIDYVIIHELCHLREHRHNRIFYQLLSIALPDWEDHKTKLDQVGFIEDYQNIQREL